MPLSIETCERFADSWIDHEGKRRPKYHAQIKGKPGCWGCGKTTDEAIGSLVRSHPEYFGLSEISDLGAQPR
jgi:hypothetical protein